MYSLSQDNWPFRKKMLNEPTALDVLARVVADQPSSKAGAIKSKNQTQTKVEQQDLSQLLRLLAFGMCIHPQIHLSTITKTGADLC